jgi:hypothetical protein
MVEKFNIADFLHKNSGFFGSENAERNVLIFGYVILLPLFYPSKQITRSGQGTSEEKLE